MALVPQKDSELLSSSIGVFVTSNKTSSPGCEFLRLMAQSSDAMDGRYSQHTTKTTVTIQSNSSQEPIILCLIASLISLVGVGEIEPITVPLQQGNQPGITIEKIKEYLSRSKRLPKECQLRWSREGPSLPDEQIIQGGAVLYLTVDGDQRSNTPLVLQVRP